MLKLKNVSKCFEGKLALNRLSMEINEGEFLVLAGPSGCGKSTLLRLLAGLEPVTDGEIWFHGDNITDQPPRERNFAMIFQNYALFPHLTVKENIIFGMKVRGEDKSGWQSRMEKVAHMLQLLPLLNNKPGKLSGGQRQRVAMARAIIRNPRLFLMDEPLSNLDARLRTEVRDSIMQLHKKFRTTTIYVTHDQTEAMSMADRIVVMNNGEVQQIGKPEHIYCCAENLFVAKFIGFPAMNILLLPCENGAVIVGERLFTLPHDAKNLSKVYFGIRPEHITEVQGENPSMLYLSGIISQRELMGAHYLLYVNTAVGTLRYQRSHRAMVPDTGSKINIGFSISDVHLFHPDTQENLFQEKHHA